MDRKSDGKVNCCAKIGFFKVGCISWIEVVVVELAVAEVVPQALSGIVSDFAKKKTKHKYTVF